MSEQNDTPSVDLAQHLELAAFHLYELCRSWSKVVLPSFADDDVQDMRRDAKYRAMAAHRRGIKSCRGIARERIAAVLAVADGLTWPACHRPGGAVDLPRDAQRRQRYRHVAGIVMAELFMYLEHDTDCEEQRSAILAELAQQRKDDTKVVAEWRARVGLPSTVSQLPVSESER